MYSKSEEDCMDAYTRLKNSIPGSNINALTYIKDLYEKRIHFAEYSISKVMGSRMQKGSTVSEQNHSSMLSYVHSSLSKRSKHSPHSFLRELLLRQRQMIDHLNKLLVSAHLRQTVLKSDLLNGSPVLSSALGILNMPAYDLFAKQCQLSLSFTVEEVLRDGALVHRVIGDQGAKVYEFTRSNRCGCRIRISYMMQCCHEVAAYKVFDITCFDVCHTYRNQASFSYNIGSWQNKCINENSIMEKNTRKDKETIPSEEVEEESLLYDDGFMNDGNDFNNNEIDGLPSVKGDEESHRLLSKLPATSIPSISQPSTPVNDYRDMEAVCTQFLKHFGKKNKTTETVLKGIILEMNKQMLDESNIALFEKKAMNIFAYLSGCQNNMIHPTSERVINPFVKAASTGKLDRMKPVMEQVMRKNDKAKKTCTFCKQTGHQTQNCGVRRDLGIAMNYADTISFILSKMPYRQLNEMEELKPQLPDGTYYFRIMGVVLSTNCTLKRTNMSFDMKDVALWVTVLTQTACEIETLVIQGDIVVSKMGKSPSREVFIYLDKSKGKNWYTR
jgi:hypothetical protein